MSLTILPFALVAVSLLSGPRVSAQIVANIQCNTSYSWASNSLQQNPCVVAAYLAGECSNGEFTIPPLTGPGDGYYPPGTNTTLLNDTCACNTIVYSLISACSDCQGGHFGSWSEWSVKCESTSVTKLPMDIPPGTAVPGWAYLNVLTTDGTYDPLVAMAASSQPESTFSPSSTSTSRLSTTSTSITSTTSTSSTSTTSTSSTFTTSGSSTSAVGAQSTSKLSRATNVGATAGGVVFLGTVTALAVFFILRRRRARTAPSTTYGSMYSAGGYASLPLTTKESSHDTTAMTPHIATLEGGLRYYNPADPSTYPTLPASGTHHGAYGGAPEV